MRLLKTHVTVARLIDIETPIPQQANSTFAFHLACLAARTGSLQEARDWVGKAIELAEDQETLDRLRLRVLDEPTLEAIWKDSQDRKGGLK